MRLLPSLLVLALTFGGQLVAQNSDSPTPNGIIPNQSVVVGVASPAIDLRNYFQVSGITGQVVQFTTVKGIFNVEMNATTAPNTVANFLSYVNAGSYTNSFIHRSDPFAGLIQGGSFLTDSNLDAIATNAPISLETADSLPNSRGTIAMARNTNPNSATSGWFINDTENSSSLPPASSSGYAAFGRVTGTGMTVVDNIFALPLLGGSLNIITSSQSSAHVTIDANNLPSNFGTGSGWWLLGGQIQNVTGNSVNLSTNANRDIGSTTSAHYSLFPNPFDQMPGLTNVASFGTGSISLSDLVTVKSVKVAPIFPASANGPSVVTFSAVSSNPNLVSATVSGSNLNIAAVANLNGSAVITVTATDSNGNGVSQTPFSVNVTRKVLDFNNDGHSDIVFQNTAGQIATWYLNSSGTATGSAYLFTGGLGDWQIVGIADMNLDGIPDFIFQNKIGQIAVWYLNASGATVSSAYIYSGGLGDWRVVATADIDRDGNTDLIFQNTAGQIAVWYMNGSGSSIGSAYLYSGGLGDWRVKCAADINSDGILDLVFQNSIGQIAVWYLNANGASIGSDYIYAGGLGDWKIASATDINGDGNTDLIFQNTAGQIAVWYMNGSGSSIGSAYLYSGGLGDWRLH